MAIWLKFKILWSYMWSYIWLHIWFYIWVRLDKSMLDFMDTEYDYLTTPKKILNFHYIFNIEYVIGSGDFGVVFLIKNRKTGNPYALKLYYNCENDVCMSDARLDHFETEFKTLKFLNTQHNSNYVKYYDNFIIPKIGEIYNGFAILLEYIPGVVLNKYPITSDSDLLYITRWILEQNINLENLDIIHCDLHDNNIIVTYDLKTQINRFRDMHDH